MTQRKKRWGDRWDAYRLRGLDPMHVMMPYLFGERTANEAVLGETFDLTEVDKYLAKKNAENPEFKYTWFHFITAAIAKTILLRPKMNYFIAGGHYYEHDSIQVAFNMKRKFADDAEEAMAKFVLRPEGDSPPGAGPHLCAQDGYKGARREPESWRRRHPEGGELPSKVRVAHPSLDSQENGVLRHLSQSPCR